VLRRHLFRPKQKTPAGLSTVGVVATNPQRPKETLSLEMFTEIAATLGIFARRSFLRLA